MARFQHPLEVYGVQEILNNGLKTKDVEIKDMLIMILMELRRMNDHLYAITDEEISHVD